MAKVRLEVIPWLSASLDGGSSDRVVLEEGIVEGQTLRELLDRLARRHPRFGEYVYDVERQRLAGFASVVINEQAIGKAPDLDQLLHDGDSLVFLPPYVGGMS
jgi:molybdopterin converting factor small subunit